MDLGSAICLSANSGLVNHTGSEPGMKPAMPDHEERTSTMRKCDGKGEGIKLIHAYVQLLVWADPSLAFFL